MKKLLFSFILLGLLAGCAEEPQENTASENVNEEETVKTEDIASENTETEEESDQDQTEQAGEESAEKEADQEVKEKEPQYTVNANNWSIQPITDANEQVALLTIDDAPDMYAVEMAKTLKSLNAPAIFFVNGHFLDTEEEKQKLKEIYDMGFAIGNHTFNHQKLDDVSEDKQREEIIKLNELIVEITGEKPKFFRAPHGVNTDFVKQLAKEEGMALMNWTYGYDYFKPYMDAEKLKTAMISGEAPEVDVPYSLLKPGANLLMHDREWTNEALADIVQGLRDKGYEMVDPELIQTPQL
ncbi:polysaccharide deacetylase family protein [Bacillus sp. AK031]